MSAGKIKPVPSVDPLDPLLAPARKVLADIHRERGDTALADSIERGDQDKGWGIQHQLKRLRAEGAK